MKKQLLIASLLALSSFAHAFEVADTDKPDSQGAKFCGYLERYEAPIACDADARACSRAVVTHFRINETEDGGNKMEIVAKNKTVRDDMAEILSATGKTEEQYCVQGSSTYDGQTMKASSIHKRGPKDRF